MEACRLHSQVYGMLQRHIMGITAAQFVWESVGEEPPLPEREASVSSAVAPHEEPQEEGRNEGEND